MSNGYKVGSCMGNRDFITFDFDQLKRQKSCKKIYKDSVFKYINSNKDKIFSIIDEYSDVSFHTWEQVEMHFIKNPIKSALRKEDAIYIECMKNKAGSKQKYILINKKINRA